MKKLVRVMTVIKVCFVIVFFAGIAFATTPTSSGPGSGGGGSGPQSSQSSKQCGSDVNIRDTFFVFFTLGFLALILFLLLGKKFKAFEDDPNPPCPPSNPSPKAQIREPSGAFKSIPLQTGSNSIGRDSNNRISLDDPKASRNHADLNVSPEGKYVLTDLGSQNGTTVNGARISQQEIFGGDQIGIGDSSITIS